MDFLQYVFVLLNEALVVFSNYILTYGADLGVSLLWVGIAFYSFSYFYAFNLTTPLSGFVNRTIKKGKYLNEGALGGPFHRVHQHKLLWQLGLLLVEIEDNNQDTSFSPSGAKRRSKRVMIENMAGIQFNWEYAIFLLDPNPLKARRARRAFVGSENWLKFKEKISPKDRKGFYNIAIKLA